MNKNELVQGSSVSLNKVDEVLAAMRLRTDSENYTDENLRRVKEALSVMESQGINAKEAVKQIKSSSLATGKVVEGPDTQPKNETVNSDPSKSAVQQAAAIAVTSKSEMTQAAVAVEIPQSAQATLEIILKTAADEDLRELPTAIGESTQQAGAKLRHVISQESDRVYFEKAEEKFKDPEFQKQVSEALKKARSHHSESTSI